MDTSYVKNVHGLTYSAEIRPIVAVKLPRSCCSQILEVLPLRAVLHRANKSNVLTLKPTLETFQRKVNHGGKSTELLADKGYDASRCRSVCQQHGLIASIPRRRTQDVYIDEDTL